MNLQTLYETATHPNPFCIREYVTPHCSHDPKSILLQNNSPQKKQYGKFKVVTKPRVCYFDQIIRPFTKNPSPSKYLTSGSLQRRSRSHTILKVDLKTRKNTYIENMEDFEKKHKPPGTGKYDLTKISDFSSKRKVSPKSKELPLKHNNFDDVIKVAAGMPGPGQFNPHLPSKTVKPDSKDCKFYKQKHAEEDKKIMRSQSAKLCPNTYSPFPTAFATFGSMAANKDSIKPISRWSHGEIDIRKGLSSREKHPSPADRNEISQWAHLREKGKPIGSYKLLDKVCLSVRPKSVYRS